MSESDNDVFIWAAKISLESKAHAVRILCGEAATPQEISTLASQLKQANEFGLARRLFARARQDPRCQNNPSLRLKLLRCYNWHRPRSEGYLGPFSA